MDSRRRTLEGIGAKAKEWKADALRRKYAPPDALEDAHLPSTDEVKGKLAMDSLEAQAEPNAQLADDTLSENKRALEGLDEEKMASLLASIKR